jgi:hypothetical protein
MAVGLISAIRFDRSTPLRGARRIEALSVATGGVFSVPL